MVPFSSEGKRGSSDASPRAPPRHMAAAAMCPFPRSAPFGKTPYFETTHAPGLRVQKFEGSWAIPLRASPNAHKAYSQSGVCRTPTRCQGHPPAHPAATRWEGRRFIPHAGGSFPGVPVSGQCPPSMAPSFCTHVFSCRPFATPGPFYFRLHAAARRRCSTLVHLKMRVFGNYVLKKRVQCTGPCMAKRVLCVALLQRRGLWRCPPGGHRSKVAVQSARRGAGAVPRREECCQALITAAKFAFRGASAASDENASPLMQCFW